MKKIVLSIAASFVSLFISAQVTQSASDTIVLERMSKETRLYTLHAKEGVQTQYNITTSAGEELELDYPCRVYYVSYMEDTNISCYLIVKESNGNLLEVNTKNTAQPDNLSTWRAMKVIGIPVTDYSPGSGCDWNFNNIKEDSVYIINSQEELLSFITCTGGSTPPVIDFDWYSLLLVHGNTMYGSIADLTPKLALLSPGNYRLTAKIQLQDTADAQQWHTAILVPKLTQSAVRLNIYYPHISVWKYTTPSEWKIWWDIDGTITLTMDTLLKNYSISTTPQDLCYNPAGIGFRFYDGLAGKYIINENKIRFNEDNEPYNHYYLFIRTMLSSDSMLLQYAGIYIPEDYSVMDYLFIKQNNY